MKVNQTSSATESQRLTTSEFAKLAGTRRQTVYRWLKEGRIQAHMKGFKLLEFDASELDKLNAPRPRGPRGRTYKNSKKRAADPITASAAKDAAEALGAMIGESPAPAVGTSEDAIPLVTDDGESAKDYGPGGPAGDTTPEAFKEAILKSITDSFGGRAALNLRMAWKDEEDNAINFAKQLIPGLRPEHAAQAVKALSADTVKRRASVWLPNILAAYQMPED